MAASSGLKSDHGSVVEEHTVFTYDRLAEDMLTSLYEQFKVPKKLIPICRYPTNFYKHPVAINFIVRQTKVDQILYRAIFYNIFIADNSAEKAGQDITKLYQYVADCMQYVVGNFVMNNRKSKPIKMFHISLAFVVELTLFQIQNKNRSIIKKMARTWVSYFNNFLKEGFEAKGGIAKVLKKANDTAYTDAMTFGFILEHSIPYTGQDVYDLYITKLRATTEEYIRLTIDSSRKQTLIRNLELSSGVEEKPKPLPVHERLGIVLHEDILKRQMEESCPKQLDASTVSTVDESTAKAIAALSLRAERRRLLKPNRNQSYSKMKKEKLYPRDKLSDENLAVESIVDAKNPNGNFCGRLPALHGQSPDSDNPGGKESALHGQSPDSDNPGGKVPELHGQSPNSDNPGGKVPALHGQSPDSDNPRGGVPALHGQSPDLDNPGGGVPALHGQSPDSDSPGGKVPALHGQPPVSDNPGGKVPDLHGQSPDLDNPGGRVPALHGPSPGRSNLSDRVLSLLGWLQSSEPLNHRVSPFHGRLQSSEPLSNRAPLLQRLMQDTIDPNDILHFRRRMHELMDLCDSVPPLHAKFQSSNLNTSLSRTVATQTEEPSENPKVWENFQGARPKTGK